MKGYKVFNPDWTCQGFQYEVGKTYTHEGEISLCNSGFHFCTRLADCFSYYLFDRQNKVAEVIAEGETIAQDDDSKAVTDKITIVRELSWHEVLDMVNSGKNCTGFKNSSDYNSGNCNSGNRNSGDWNSGNRNSGNYNSGYCNSGNRNSGDWNSGNRNSGNYNSGYWNSGNRNSGNYNSGYWNSGNYNSGYWNSGDCNSGNCNSGFFNTITPKATFFNKPTNLNFEEVYELPGMYVLRENFSNNIWIASSDMTDEEKQAHPEHETCGGYLKALEYKDAWHEMWNKLNEDEKAAVKALPNFDSNVFYEITGIKVE